MKTLAVLGGIAATAAVTTLGYKRYAAVQNALDPILGKVKLAKEGMLEAIAKAESPDEVAVRQQPMQQQAQKGRPTKEEIANAKRILSETGHTITMEVGA